MDKMTSGKGGGKALLAAAGIFLYLMACVIAGSVDGLITISDHISEDIGPQAGAGEVAAWVRENESVFEDGGIPGFDRDEMLQVMDAVEKYNEACAREVTVTYEYQHYKGMVESYDADTGEVSVTGWDEVSTGQEQVGTERVQIGTERVEVTYTQEELDAMAAAMGGAYFTPPPAYHIRGIYEDRPVYETVETTRHIDPTIETLTDTVTLSRKDTDFGLSDTGEDVLLLDWRPVLVLCHMMTQSGEYLPEDGRENLSEEKVAQAIGFFGYQYSYLDDPSQQEGEFDGSASRYERGNAGYRVSTEGEPVTGVVCDFTIKRIPQIAPKIAANAYLTYEYEYEPVSEGAQERILVARSIRLDGSSFEVGCSEICEGFDAELFCELLALLPGGEEVSDYYRTLCRGRYEETRTTDEALCPSIGTLVSAPGGTWRVKSAAQFYAGITGSHDDGYRPQGTDSAAQFPSVPSTDFTPSASALADPDFAAVWQNAVSCLGTPYVFGGNGGPGVSFDCSAFVSHVLRASGYEKFSGWPNGRESTTSLLGSATGITEGGLVTAVSGEELSPGDLIFFKGTIRDRSKSHVSHVAIYLGDGMMIHASSSAGEVAIVPFEGSTLKANNLMCYGRPKK